MSRPGRGPRPAEAHETRRLRSIARRSARVGLLGGGVIGGGWAARFLLHGVDVRLYDPDPDAARKVGEVLDNARRASTACSTPRCRPRARSSFVGTPEEAVDGADFVQESAPERLDAQAGAAGRGQPGRRRRTSCSRRPRQGCCRAALQRGHAPPGAARRRSSVQPGVPPAARRGLRRQSTRRRRRASAPSTSTARVGMRPLVLRTEIDGFVADRLLEALWREALWLVERRRGDGRADRRRHPLRAPGCGGAAMGTFLTYRIAGGEAGMRHFMEQFGPALQWPWTQADGRARVDRRAARPHRRAVRRAGCRAQVARARGTSATTASSP